MKLPVPKWEFGTPLYLKVNGEMCGALTGVLTRPGPVLIYLVTWGDGDEKEHHEFELTDERNWRAGDSETETG